MSSFMAKDGSSPSFLRKAIDEKIKDDKKSDSDKPADDKKKHDKSKASDKDKSDKNDKDADKEKDKDKKDEPVKVTVDLEDIGNRILSLPIPARNYSGLLSGKDGVIYLLEGSAIGRSSNGRWPSHRSQRLEVHHRKARARTGPGQGGCVHCLRRRLQGALCARAKAGRLRRPTISSQAAENPGKPLNLGGLQTTIDPRAEWRQIYRETWRIERDFLYDPNTHGLSIPKIEAKYEPYLDNLASRSEFTYLSTEMLGEITIGHMFVGGPRSHDRAPKTGLLGADYTIENGRYKIAKILGGQNWTPGLASPLTLPGVYVRTGAYILAVNGRELHASDNLYEAFKGTAGKQTILHISYSADGKDPHDVTVVPIDDEDGLRNIDWVESNRRKVDELSGGKVAYVYMPNTGGAGYDSFNRYFYAQLDKQALVLDERWNEGGFIADYIVDVLKRAPLSGAKERDGKPLVDPYGAIFGPKAMLINQNAGSGGDAMPWYFRTAEIGKLIGTRTWGGLVGIGGYPPLIDGGYVMAPRFGVYGLHGEWEVENHGIAPDIMIEELPKDVAAGHDVQLETGAQTVLDELKAHPIPEIPIPPYPNYHKNDGLGVQ